MKLWPGLWNRHPSTVERASGKAAAVPCMQVADTVSTGEQQVLAKPHAHEYLEGANTGSARCSAEVCNGNAAYWKVLRH
jgi:hypothetical protein